jgi:cytidylate kinase
MSGGTRSDDSISTRRESPIVIAIDGPAASGKSSTSRWVAEELGFLHADSGALYRAATAARLREAKGREEDQATWTEFSVLECVKRVSLRPGATSFEPEIDGERVDDELRGAEVTRHVSQVAQMARVRDWVNELIRQVARERSIVVDGRDIGTAVFPDADLKIFLIADPWERARRRLVQRLSRRPTDEEIAEETGRIAQRDASDATQTVQAKDAILIDTTSLTQSDQVERIVALARALTSGR